MPRSPVAGGGAGEAIEGIEQALTPCVDGIGRLDQAKRTDRARPVQRAEYDVIGIQRCIATDKGLRGERLAQRLQATW